MAKKKIYKHHQRTTLALLEADLQARELGVASTPKALCWSYASGTKGHLFEPIGVDVRKYGALLDGVTDDLAAIHAALAAHDYVYIPYTSTGCLTSGPIVVAGGKTIYGDRRGSKRGGTKIIKAAGNYTSFFTTDSTVESYDGICIRNFTLLGGVSANFSDVANRWGVTTHYPMSHIENVHFEPTSAGYLGNGFRLHNDDSSTNGGSMGCWLSTIRDCRFVGVIGAVPETHYNSLHIGLDMTINGGAVKVTNSSFSRADTGIWVRKGENITFDHVDIEQMVSGPAITAASGTAQAGAASTITLAAGASASNDAYTSLHIRITGGTGAGQERLISGYVGATKVATVNAAWSTTPDATSTYSITPTRAALVVGEPNSKHVVKGLEFSGYIEVVGRAAVLSNCRGVKIHSSYLNAARGWNKEGVPSGFIYLRNTANGVTIENNDIEVNYSQSSVIQSDAESYNSFSNRILQGITNSSGVPQTGAAASGPYSGVAGNCLNDIAYHLDSEVASTTVTSVYAVGSLVGVTATGHGKATGDWVWISGITGTVADVMGGRLWQITVIDANNFSLDGSEFSGAYTSGGTAWWPEVTSSPSIAGALSVDSTIQAASDIHTTGTGTGFWLDALGTKTTGFKKASGHLYIHSGSATERIVVGSGGNVSLNLGGAPNTNSALDVRYPSGITGALQFGIIAQGTFTSSATTRATALQASLSFQDASFTCTSAVGLFVEDANKPAAVTLTNQYGIKVDDQTKGGTNYAIYTGLGLVRFGNDTIIIASSKTPSSATDTGTQGMIAWDSSYIYICTASNTWKRVAIATW